MIRKVLIDITDYSMIRTRLPGHFETWQYFLACPKLKKKIVLINQQDSAFSSFCKCIYNTEVFHWLEWYISLFRPKVTIFLVYLKNRYTIISCIHVLCIVTIQFYNTDSTPWLHSAPLHSTPLSFFPHTNNYHTLTVK